MYYGMMKVVLQYKVCVAGGRRADTTLAGRAAGIYVEILLDRDIFPH